MGIDVLMTGFVSTLDRLEMLPRFDLMLNEIRIYLFISRLPFKFG